MQRRKERARYLDLRRHADPAAGGPGRRTTRRARGRRGCGSGYRVVLVDEFQDTDPIQWDILRRAFHGHGTLVVIGDPKQAIYAFRGADVNSYLRGGPRGRHDRHPGHLLPQRPRLLDGLDLIWAAAVWGTPRSWSARSAATIADRPASDRRPVRGPVRLRVVPPRTTASRSTSNAAQTRREATWSPRSPSCWRRQIAPALRLDGGRGRGPGRPVRASDLAVLVRRNAAGEQIRDALADAGIPAVLHGSDSVFSSAAAQDWLRLLLALEQPRQALVRDAALTDLVGWTFPRLAQADEPALAELAYAFRRWSSGAGPARRRGPDGDPRHRHRAERAGAGPAGRRTAAHRPAARRPTAARRDDQSRGSARRACGNGWQRRSRPRSPRTAPRALRRLATDAAAVQVLTLHRSKGLQFPIVYLPEAWDCFVPADERRCRAATACRRDGSAATSAGDRPGRPERWRSRWPRRPASTSASVRRADAGPVLGGDLVGRLARNTADLRPAPLCWSRDAASRGESRHLVPGDRADPPQPARPAGTSTVEIGRGRAPAVRRRPTGRRPRPTCTRAGAFDRMLDHDWRRTSYSSLTAAAHGAAPAARQSRE